MLKFSRIAAYFLAVGTAGLVFPNLSLAKPRVVLDAAHGGSDTGVRAGSETEKEWNAKFALALEKALEAEGFEVVQARKKDETLPLDRRTALINTSQAAAAVVVHADREWTGTQKGPLLVVEPPNRTEADNLEIARWGVTTPALYRSSLKLARDIAQKLGVSAELSPLSDSRGLAGEHPSPNGRILCLPHQSLRNLALPAVVLTPLFLTSPSDLKRFSQPQAVADWAARAAEGIADYLQGAP